MDPIDNQTAVELVGELRRVAALLERLADGVEGSGGRYLTPTQAAALLPIGDDTLIRTLIQRGQLRGSKIRGRYVTTAADVHAYVEENSNKAARLRAQPRRRRAT